MDWTVAGAIAGSLLTLVAGWAWGTAYGYRKGMQARPTLIDPISEFLKGQDKKQARAEEKAWEKRTDTLLPAQVREMEAKPIPLMGGNQAQRVQANRPGREGTDVLGFTKPTRKTRSDAGKPRQAAPGRVEALKDALKPEREWLRVIGSRAKVPTGWRVVRDDGQAKLIQRIGAKAPAQRRYADRFYREAPSPAKGKAATPGKAKGKAPAARRAKGRPAGPQRARNNPSKGRRG